MSERSGEFAVAILGAGAAGASLAAVLARQGLKTALIEPRVPQERGFRAEKFTPAQWARIGDLGLQQALLPILTHEASVWIARRGRLIDKCASNNRNYRYPALVSALRKEALAQGPLEFMPRRAVEIIAGPDRQAIRLDDGRLVTARLAVIAMGVGGLPPKELGFERRLVFASHSVSIGFDLLPLGRKSFAFPALTYHGERPADRVAYLSLFPIENFMRGNLFVYRCLNDPWLKAIHAAPDAALRKIMPGLGPLIGDFAASEPVALRQVDLFRAENVRRPGVVLIGDSFGTACPASGSGLDTVFSDVARLVDHLPHWLATPGMGAEKIARFYDDPQKIAADAGSLARSRFLREMTIQPGLRWRMRRDIGFIAQAARGKLRAAIASGAIREAETGAPPKKAWKSLTF